MILKWAPRRWLSHASRRELNLRSPLLVGFTEDTCVERASRVDNGKQSVLGTSLAAAIAETLGLSVAIQTEKEKSPSGTYGQLTRLDAKVDN